MANFEYTGLEDAHTGEIVDALTDAGIPGVSVTNIDGVMTVSVPDGSEPLAQSVLASFTSTVPSGEIYKGNLSPAVKAEAIRIKESANRTNAQLDAAFPAGPTRELAYAVRATCRALIFLVESRLGD